MKFTATKKDLVAELALLAGVADRKTTIPILANVAFIATDGVLKCSAYDLEVGISTVIEADVKVPGSTTIPAKRLYDYLRLLPDGEVAFNTTTEGWVSITSGRSNTRMATLGIESFPELPKPTQLAAFGVKDLAKLVERTAYAISTEESRFTLSGALLVTDGNTATIVTTDSHRLALATTTCKGEATNALLPMRLLKQVERLCGGAEDIVKYGYDENHIFFRFGQRQLIGRRMTGNFPDYARVLPKDLPRYVDLNRDDLKAAMGRALQFSDERSRAVKMSFTSEGLIIAAAVNDTGATEETLSINHTDALLEDIVIGFNGQYILDAIACMDGSTARFEFKDSMTAGVFVGDGHKCVIMPMRT